MLHDAVVIIIFVGLLALYGLALYTLVSSVIELFRKDRKDDNEWAVEQLKNYAKRKLKKD